MRISYSFRQRSIAWEVNQHHISKVKQADRELLEPTAHVQKKEKVAIAVDDQPGSANQTLQSIDKEEGKQSSQTDASEGARSVPLTCLEDAFFLTAGNYQVQFLRQDNKWKAQVQGSWTGGRGSGMLVPLYLAPGITPSAVNSYSPLLQKKRLYVLFDPGIKNRKMPIGVYVGPGLCGGMPATKLHEAIQSGDIWEKNGEYVIKSPAMPLVPLRELRYCLNQTDDLGATPLHWATCSTKQTPLHWAVSHIQGDEGVSTSSAEGSDYTTIISKLVALGADINAQDERGYTPLHVAVESKNTHAISSLIRLGADKNKQDHKRNTPLHVATNLNHTDIAKQLIDLGASLYLTGEYGNEAIHCAVLQHNQVLVEYLIKKGASACWNNTAGQTPLELAAACDQWEYIPKIFSLNRAELNQVSHQDGLSHLHRAVQKNNVKLIKKLLEIGIDINLQEQIFSTAKKHYELHRSALHIAVEQENIELIKYLVEKGARKDIQDKNGKTALDYAWDKLIQPIGAPILSALGVNLEVPGGQGTILIGQAIQAGNQELVKNLIIAGVNVHAADAHGNTPLHIAIEAEQLEIAKELSALGAHPKTKNKQGTTPILLVLQSKKSLQDIKTWLQALQVDVTKEDKEGNTMLHNAIKEGDEHLIKLLLSTDLGIDKNKKNKEGKTALHLAVEQGKAGAVAQLLTLGVDKNHQDKERNTPLHLAIKAGHDAIAKQLIDAGASLGSKNQDGNNALHNCILTNNQELGIYIVKKDHNPLFWKNNAGLTPIDLASSLKRLEEAKILLSLHLDKISYFFSNTGLGHLLHAIQRKDVALVKLLLSLGINKNAKEQSIKDGKTTYHRSALHMAVEQEDIEIIQCLVAAGANQEMKDKDDKTAIDYVLSKADRPCFGKLLAALFDLSEKGEQGPRLLREAILAKNVPLAKQLITAGIKVNAVDQTGKTALHHAVVIGDEQMIIYCLKQGAHKNAPDQQGNTPLHLACQQGNDRIIRLLIVAGADKTIENAAGLLPIHLLVTHQSPKLTPQLLASLGLAGLERTTHLNFALHRAVLIGDITLVQQLITLGANVHATDLLGRTPFHAAVKKNDLWLVEILRAAGADIGVKDGERNTPLHLAASQGAVKLADYLVAHGAKAQVENQQGETPLYLAAIHADQTLSEQLLKIFQFHLNCQDGQGNGPLHRAVALGDSLLVQALLQRGGDDQLNKNGQNARNKTPLHLAIELGHQKIVPLLLAADVDKHAKDQTGNTPLHIAVLKRNVEMVEVLLEAGADVHARNQASATPLHEAVAMGEVSIIASLLTAKSDLHAVNQRGLTPIELVREAGRDQVLPVLLQDAHLLNQPNRKGITHLHRSVRKGDLPLVKALLKHQAQVVVQDKTGRTPFHDAASQGSLELLKELFHYLPAPGPFQRFLNGDQSPLDQLDQQHQTPLHLAIAGGHIALTTWLLDQKANLYHQDTAGITPLQLALQAQDKRLLHALVSLPTHSPLNWAVEHGDIALIQALITAGIDINTMDCDGKSPLYKSFELGNIAMTQALIAMGAALNAQDTNGKTLLHHAILHGSQTVVHALIQAGAQVNVSDYQGNHELHRAAEANQDTLVAYLVAAGIAINAPNQAGQTPLHLAAMHGHHALAVALIQSGANLQAIDLAGNIPLYYPLSEGKFDVVEVISAAYEYKLSVMRSVENLRSNKKKIRQANYEAAFPTLQESKQRSNKKPFSFTHWISERLLRLHAAEKLIWEEQFIPLFKKYLASAHRSLQEQVKNYLEKQGNVYPLIIENYPVQAWVKESLLLDLSKEAGTTDDERALATFHFQEQFDELTTSYTREEIEQLLFHLRKKQLQENLKFSTLTEVLTYLQPLGPSEALTYLSLTDGGWRYSLRLAWMNHQLKNQTQFSASQRRQLSYAGALLPYKGTLLARLVSGLDGLKTEEDFQAAIRFFAFITKHPASEKNLLLATYQKPKAAKDNLLQSWQQYIGCALLQATLSQRYGTLSTQQIEKQFADLLTKQWVYEPLQATLKTLINHNDPAHAAELTCFSDVVALMIEYGLEASTCEAILELVKTLPKQAWEKTAHALALSATFGTSKDLNEREVMDYMVAHAPQAPFVNDRTALENAYKGIENNYKQVAKLGPPNKKIIAHWGVNEVKAWAQHVKGSEAMQKMSLATQQEALAVIKQAVNLIHHYPPRATQLLSLLAFLNHAPGKGRLAQINTGEGKSLIVVMLAILHALSGKQVDIVTTSTELSIPEAAKQKQLIELFDLTVGENSVEEDAKKAVYAKDIVYGTAANFQGDILRTEFLGKDIRGGRNFEIVIVDEVDSMLFDSRRASIRLSNPTPAMQHLELLLATIYSQVDRALRHMIEKEGVTYYIQEDFEIKEGKILLYGSTSEVDITAMRVIEDKEAFIEQVVNYYIEDLLRTPTGEEKEEWEAYQTHHDKLVYASIEADCEENEKEREKKIARYEELAAQVEELAWKKNDRNHIIQIPTHLYGFAKKQLPMWTKQAIRAIGYFKKEVHYDVVDKKIVPIDYDNTGVLQKMMVWSDGLAQMLQIKEGLRVEPENISTNFISVPEYFKRYENAIYGMSGTLGNDATQTFLTEVYGVDTIIIPPYRQIPIAGNTHSAYLCKELPALLVPTLESWQEAIVSTTLRKVRNQRAVLIICKYIEQVHALAQSLSHHHDPEKIFTYTGQVDFKKSHIDAAEIIIATNIAGRGTDITTKKIVEENGGLHVCITFLPDNYRVELQNAGRTARQGKQGTAQLVILDQEGTTIDNLRTARDEQETYAIQKAQGDIADMLSRDALFKSFCALEAQLLPTLAHDTRESQLNRLWTLFHAHKKKSLENQLLKVAARRLYGQKTPPKLSLEQAQQELLRIQESFYQQDQAMLTKNLESQWIVQICSLAQGKYPTDVIEAFRKGYTQLKDNAMQLGDEDPFLLQPIQSLRRKYERMGLEEAWGLWLHHAGKDPQFHTFVEQSEQKSRSHTLMENPYYPILLAKELINSGRYYQAVQASNQAIALDPLHSVNGYYNKAWALIAPKDNKENLQEAKEALRNAKSILANHAKPNLVNFNSIVASTGGEKPHLLEHTQHQLNILMKQESYIDAAIKEINKAQKENWNLELTEVKLLEDILKEEKGNHAPAISKAKLHGLDELFVVKAKEPFPIWSILALAVLGVAQVVAGAMVYAYSGGTSGMGLMSEGISDLLAGVKAGISGTFSWSEWGLQKSISIVSSLLTSGIDAIKKACENIKNAVTNIKGFATTSLQETFKTAIKQSALEAGKGTAKMLATHLVDSAIEKWGIQKIEAHIKENIVKSLEGFITNNQLLMQALALDNKNQNHDWQQLFLQEGLAILMHSDNKIMQFIKGVAGNLANQGIAELGRYMARSQEKKEEKGELALKLFFQSVTMIKAMQEMLCMTQFFWDEFIKNVENKHKKAIEAALEVQAQKEKEAEKKQTGASTQQVASQSAPASIEQFTLPPDPIEGELPTARLESGIYHSSRVENKGPELLAYCPGAPSSKGSISEQFAEVLKKKINGKMQSAIVHPVTSGIASWSIEKVSKGLTENVKELVKEQCTKR
eukprot:gene568-713_t